MTTETMVACFFNAEETSPDFNIILHCNKAKRTQSFGLVVTGCLWGTWWLMALRQWCFLAPKIYIPPAQGAKAVIPFNIKPFKSHGDKLWNGTKFMAI